MSTDTPRTDAAMVEWAAFKCSGPNAIDQDPPNGWDHARQLERELAEAKKEIVHLRGQIDFASRDNANLLMAKYAAAASDRDEARRCLREAIKTEECEIAAAPLCNHAAKWKERLVRWRAAAGLEVKP